MVFFRRYDTGAVFMVLWSLGFCSPSSGFGFWGILRESLCVSLNRTSLPMPHQVLRGLSSMVPPNYKKPIPEKIDILDEQGLRTGDVLSRKEVHADGKIHRAVHLYLFDTNKQILIQKRSLNSDHYPGFWSISLTAHVNAGETSGQALRRELEEELGIHSKWVHLEFLFSYRRDATLGPDYVDRQIHDVFAGILKQKSPILRLQREEVAEVRFVSFSDFLNMVKDENNSLVPVYKEPLKDVLYYLKAHPFFRDMVSS